MPEPRMQLEDWLDDLCVRFIINLPTEDLSSVARICFQVEEAQWFYEDFIRPLDPTLPSMSLRSFCLRIFQHCPLLASFSAENHMRAFEEFLQYKTRIPVRGAILLNEAMDSTVLVKGWKKNANWSFPRGKINKDEDDLDCAIREVEEETGFNIKEAGLVPKDDEVKYIEISMRDQQIRLYVFRNIPMDTAFQPKTRKEISAIEWYKLSELPAFRKKGNRLEDTAAATNANKFYMVAPFLVPLKKWVVQQKKKDAARGAHLPVQLPIEEVLTEDDIGTQTDTQPQQRTQDSIPAIETLEGATSELKRLLKVQPPTQGVQMGSLATPSPDKGEALMAILQKASANPPAQPVGQPRHLQPSQPFQGQIPHTPLDHIYTNPPEPHSPHFHHAAHRLPAHNTQPPPNYPYATGNQMQHQFNYPASYLQGQPQGGVPSHSPGMNLYQHQPLRKEPILLHPQPLPPQVQQSILTRGILPTPGLPEAGVQSGLPAHQASLLQAFVTQKPVPLSAQQQGANVVSGMTSQKQSLLDAFKTGSRATNDSGVVPRDDGMRQSANPTADQAQGNSHGWANPAALQASNPAARYLPQNVLQQQGSNNGPHNVASTLPQANVSGNRQSQATEQQRTSLLDMFKKPAPVSSPSGISTTVPSQPMENQQRTSLLDMFKTTAPVSPPSGTSKAVPSQPMENPIFARNHNNTRGASSVENITHFRTQKSPEVHLPYRPVQILSRPKPGESGPHSGSESSAQHGTAQPVSMPSPNMQSSQLLADSLKENFSSSQLSPRLYQPQPASGSPYGSFAQPASGSPYGSFAQPARGSPYGSFAQPQSSRLGTSPSTQQTRRQDPNPEQRQKLLSLFGKSLQQDHQTGSPSGFEDKVAGKMKEAVGYDQMRSGTPRSRVASLASSSVAVGGAGGVAMEKVPSLGSGSRASSRRGSQTPISPANRDFLLNFLQNVSSTGR